MLPFVIPNVAITLEVEVIEIDTNPLGLPIVCIVFFNFRSEKL